MLPCDSACNIVRMMQHTAPAPAASTVAVSALPIDDQVIEVRWANGVGLRVPAANSADYATFLAMLDDYDTARDLR